jgi:hypothetical protein
MDIEIRETLVEFDLYGLSGNVPNFDFAGTGQKLMEEMFKRLTEAGITQSGVICWVYDSFDRMFTGVEIEGNDGGALEHKPVSLRKYAYYKHVGPYEKLGDVHRGMDAGVDGTRPGRDRAQSRDVRRLERRYVQACY